MTNPFASVLVLKHKLPPPLQTSKQTKDKNELSAVPKSHYCEMAACARILRSPYALPFYAYPVAELALPPVRSNLSGGLRQAPCLFRHESTRGREGSRASGDRFVM